MNFTKTCLRSAAFTSVHKLWSIGCTKHIQQIKNASYIRSHAVEGTLICPVSASGIAGNVLQLKTSMRIHGQTQSRYFSARSNNFSKNRLRARSPGFTHSGWVFHMCGDYHVWEQAADPPSAQKFSSNRRIRYLVICYVQYGRCSGHQDSRRRSQRHPKSE